MSNGNVGAEIDAQPELDDMERALTTGDDSVRCRNILVVLTRWRDDPDFNEATRTRALQLIRRFRHRFS